MVQFPRWGCRSLKVSPLLVYKLVKGLPVAFTPLIPCRHVGLQFCDVVVTQHDGFLLVVIFEDGGEEVTGRLAFRITHGEDGSVGTFGHELVLQTVATAVASDDTADFPELEVVQELTTRYAYLAHEQLIDVAGGS